MNKTRILVEW